VATLAAALRPLPRGGFVDSAPLPRPTHAKHTDEHMGGIGVSRVGSRNEAAFGFMLVGAHATDATQ
jgi:hypothetical protein